MATPGGDRIPSRNLAGIAAFCALWCLAFLLGNPPLSYVAVPLVAIGVLALRSHPILGASVVNVANLVTLVAGVPYGSVDMMAAYAFALFSVGRMVRNRLAGLAITLAGAVPTALRAPYEPIDLIVCLVVFTCMWGFGVVVRHRARLAWRAVGELERLVAEDPAAFAAAHLAEERQRLAAEALTTLRRTVTDMQAMADEALRRPAESVGPDIQQRGAAAVAELRALLGLLRAPETPALPDPTESTAGRDPWSTVWAVVYAIAMGGTLAGLLSPPAEPDALLPLGALYAVLCWRAITRPGRWSRLLIIVLAAAATALATHYRPQGPGFIFVLFTTSLLAGRTWGERDRITTKAMRESAAMERRRDALAAEAVRAERLRVARDLHDVTSHAVGVMVLQAGAAQALSASAPDRAHAALRQVHDAGDEALREIDELLDVLDSEVTDVPDLRHALAALRDRMQAAGLHVELRLLTMPDAHDDPRSAETIHRLVREGLTNVLRHAPGARALVEVDRSDDHWLVRVANDRGSPAATPARGSGYGLTGMAERVAALGGTFSSGPGPTGGYRIEARLPDLA